MSERREEVRNLLTNSNSHRNNETEGEEVPRCRICGEEDDLEGEVGADQQPNRLFQPGCQCTGSVSYIHCRCLEHWIVVRSANSIANQQQQSGVRGYLNFEEPRLVCEICHSYYQLTVVHRYAFSWERCLRLPSLFLLVHLLILFCLNLTSLYAAWLFWTGSSSVNSSSNNSSPLGSSLATLAALLSCAAISFAARQVLARWKTSNSILCIVPTQSS